MQHRYLVVRYREQLLTTSNPRFSGIIIYYCLKGKFPWQKASIMNKSYWEWEQYLKRKIPALPKRWELFTEKSLKIFKKSLNPRPKDRWTAKDMRKCIEKSTLFINHKVSKVYFSFLQERNFSRKTLTDMSIIQKKSL